jgi:hypothetical protein
MAFEDENPIDRDLAKEVALLAKRTFKMHRQNMALEEQITIEKFRQTTYKKMKTTKDNLLKDIAKQEEEQARLLGLKAEISRQSELMEAEVLQAQKAADAKHENKDTAKE